uniref:hypothetical protein n=1 Tax=Mycolicibacterium obuense TaxID=1807 RepID=UPI003F5824C7
MVEDDLGLPTAAQYRARIERAREHARSRYHAHLTAVLSDHDIDNAAATAGVVLDALTVWRDIETGEPCRCSCHPRLPESDLHDYGADCGCTRTSEQQRASFQRALREIRDYWHTPEGLQEDASRQAAEADLQAWLAREPGVAVHSHGGWAPEQWTGEVDGHRFYFRERHGDWHIEIGPRPSGRFVRANDFAGGDSDSRRTLVEHGDVIATGTIDAEGYGSTIVQRAEFIVDIIRTHVARQVCDHHAGDHATLETVFGIPVRWCVACGARLRKP